MYYHMALTVAAMIRLLSYNIQFGKRIDRIIDWLVAMPIKPDIICFQEFPQNAIARCIHSFRNVSYEYRFVVITEKRKVKYGMLTLFRKDHIRILSSSVLSLGLNRLERSARSALITEVQYNKRRLVVANVHLACFAFNRVRYRQVEKIIMAIKKMNVPSVIAGDFNLSSILGRKKLFTLMKRHLYATVEQQVTTHRVAMVRQQLDYVFGNQIRVVKMQVEHIRFSDHFPLHIQCAVET